MAKLNPALFAQYFPAPKVSRFNRSRQIEATMKIGKLYPMNWELLSFGDSMKASTMHKLRFMPMMAPNYSNMWMQQHAAVIPLRAIMHDYEATFNYAKNRDGAVLPCISPEMLIKVYGEMGKAGVPIIGSLFDYLGYPVYGDIYKQLTKEMPFVTFDNIWKSVVTSNSVPENVTVPVGDTVAWNFVPSISLIELMTTYTSYWTEFAEYPGAISFELQFRRNGVFIGTSSGVPAFWLWILGKALSMNLEIVFEEYDGTKKHFQFLNKATQDNVTTQVLDMYRSLQADEFVSPTSALCKKAGFNTIIAATEAYMSYLHSILIYEYFSQSGALNQHSENRYSLLPLMAYHRFIGDWMLNSNFTDPDTYLSLYVFGLPQYIENLQNPIGETSAFMLKEYFLPKDRLWDYDYFTSLLPSAVTDNNISIPANATVLDLAKLTAFQKVVLRLSYSSRYRDVVWNLFKIKPSDARLNQSSVLAESSNRIGIGEDIQVSQTTESSVLGSFGGKAYGSGGSKHIHIMAEEPCIVLHFASIIPESSYMDSPDTLLGVHDIWDFPIPETDVLGNQPIYAYELTGYPEDTHVLGYGRQYYQWLANFSTCRGDMRTTLDYWHLARRFEDGAVLNEEFLSVSELDDLNRIFSLGDSTQVALSYYINNNVTRPVHRSVRVLV